jgi:hypothetical protein
VARSSTPDRNAGRELTTWERHLFDGVRLVGPDEVRPYVPPREYDGPVRPGPPSTIVRYYGSHVEPELLKDGTP